MAASAEQKAQFENELIPVVSKICAERGYDQAAVPAIVAQACAETGWGTSTLAQEAHNYFGIKYGDNFNGAKFQGSSATWRAYSSLEEGVNGYFDLLEQPYYDNSRQYLYGDLKAASSDPSKYISQIAGYGYGGPSEQYKSLVEGVMKENNLIEKASNYKSTSSNTTTTTTTATNTAVTQQTQIDSNPNTPSGALTTTSSGSPITDSGRKILDLPLSRNFTKGRGNNKIETITLHIVDGDTSVQSLSNYFNTTERQASSHYGIGSNGDIGRFVSESDTAWTNGPGPNGNAVTIEVANLKPGEVNGKQYKYPITNEALNSLIYLVADIAIRNNLQTLYHNDQGTGTITWHCDWAQKACPGDYVKEMTPYICAEANKIIAAYTGRRDPSIMDSSSSGGDINIDPLTFESARQCLNRANQILDGMITTNNMDQSFLSRLDKGTTFNTASFKSNWQSGCANLYSRVTNVIEAITAADATQASLFDKYKSMDLAGLYASVLQEQTGVTKPQTETTPTETKPTDTQSTTQPNTQNTNSNSTGNQTTNTTGGNTNSGGSTTGGYSGGYSGGSSSGGNSSGGSSSHSGGSSSHSGGSSSGSGSGSGGSSSSENTQTQKPETKPVETKPTEPTQTETKPQEQVQVKDEELEKYEQEELEIEKEKLEIEKERLELEKQRLEYERNKEPIKIENNNVNNNTFGGSSNGNGKTDTTSDTNQNTTSTNENGNIVIENNNINNNVYNAPSSTSGGSTSKPSVSRPSTNTTPSVNNKPTVNTPVIENKPSIEDTPVVELPPVENNDNFFVTPGGLDTPEIPNVEVISPVEDIKPVETITPTVQKSSNNTGLILGAAAATAAVGAAAYGAYKYTKKKEEETGYAYEDKNEDY